MSFTEFQIDSLNCHNEKRANHSASPLELDADICQYAQEWADYLACMNVIQHRPDNSYGENIYASFGRTDIAGWEPVDSWYDEIQYYQFEAPSPSNFMQVGHFTQMVWKKSEKMGIGIANNGCNVYVVCNYDPPGNYLGQYHNNVSRS